MRWRTGESGRMKRFAVLLLALTVLVLAACQSIVEPRSGITPEDVVAAFEAQPDLPVTDPVALPEGECSPDAGCIAAVRAAEISVYRFGSTDEAAAFATSLGDDGYQSDWIVLEYPDARYDTDSRLSSYATVVDGMWTSD